MPQAIPLAVSWAIVEFAGLEGLSAFGVYLAGSIASGAMTQYAINEKLESMNDLPSSEGILITTCSTEDRMQVVYGRRRVGGTRVFTWVKGAENQELWLVISLGEGPCNRIYQRDGVDQVFLGDKLYTEYGGNVQYWFHSGTPDQAVDEHLAAAVPEWTDLRRNNCYLVMVLTWAQDYFMNLPNISVELEGRIVRDFRTATDVYSANPVLCRYDYMTHTRYGMKVTASEIDLASWGAAANYCDLKGWECNAVLAGDIKADDVLANIDILFRGQQTWWNGLYYLRYADLNYETSCLDLTDEHVARDETGKYLVTLSEPSGAGRPDGLKVVYVDPDKAYVTDTIPIGETEGVIKEVTLAYCTSRSHAATIGAYELERAQLDRQITGVFRDDALQLEPHDIANATFSAIGISGQYLRLIETGRMENGQIPMTFAFESVHLYDDEVNISEEAIYSCSLPDPQVEPPGVGNVIVTESTYAYRGRTGIRLSFTFDRPAGYDWFDHVEVWQSFDNETWSYLFPAGSDFEIFPVDEGRAYWFRLKVVSIYGRKQADANDYKVFHRVTGISQTAPSSLLGLDVIVAGNAVNLYAVKLIEADIDLYEYRLGTVWDGAIFLASMLSPNLSLNGVKPGTHTFMVNSKGTNGLYGTTPRSKTVALIDPPDGWSVASTEVFDYTTGTHDNTEHVVYSGEDHLKCSHTDGVLVGTWKSPVIDLGSSLRRLVYALAEPVVTGTATEWNTLVPDPQTWEDLNVARTWGEIFQLGQSSIFRMTLYYGDTNPPTNTVGRQEILYAIVTGRYFQIEVSIEDPSAAIETLAAELTMKFCVPA